MRVLLTTVLLGVGTLYAAVPAEASWLSEMFHNGNASVYVGPARPYAYPQPYIQPSFYPPAYLAPCPPAPYVLPAYAVPVRPSFYQPPVYPVYPVYPRHQPHPHHHR